MINIILLIALCVVCYILGFLSCLNVGKHYSEKQEKDKQRFTKEVIEPFIEKMSNEEVITMNNLVNQFRQNSQE